MTGDVLLLILKKSKTKPNPQIDLFKNYSYSIGSFEKKITKSKQCVTFNFEKKVKKENITTV